VPCAKGAFTNQTGATSCAACVAGTYASAKGQTKCDACGTMQFMPYAGSSACQNRTWACAVGKYVAPHTDKPAVDNECTLCVPCKESEFLVTAQQALSWVQQPTSMDYLCPGNTTSPLYKCVSNAPEAGFYLAGGVVAGASSDGASPGFTVNRLPCTDLPAADPDLGMMYVVGKIPGCFVGCKYGVNSVDAYNNLFWHSDAAGDDPWNNVFLPGAVALQNVLCTACPKTACGLNTFRPKVSSQCGPVCYQASGCGDGCVGACRAPPQGAVVIGGSSVLGNDTCPWACGLGWHVSEDGLGCRNCSAENPDTYCDQGSVLVDTARQCFPHSKRGDLCKACAQVEGGRPRAWNNASQQCTYECVGNYFAADETNTTCLPCSIHNGERCATGFYRDYVGCLERGTAPICRPCAFPTNVDRYDYSFTSDGGLDARNCSALCDAGFHTRSMMGVYVDAPVNVFELQQCVRCQPRVDTITCHGVCQVGQYRNRTVENGLTGGACVQCVTSAECGTGRFAMPCSGNGSADPGCMDCSPDLLYDEDAHKTQVFAPYSLRADMERGHLVFPLMGDCPRVCRPNYYISAVGKCSSCLSKVARLAAVDRADNSGPRVSDFVYSHWNATPGLVWWPTQFTPTVRAC
jgi:hypothetical protein